MHQRNERSFITRMNVHFDRNTQQESQKPKAYSMTWAQRLKRVFAIDIEKCEKCGGPVRINASNEDPDVIQKILQHLGLDQPGDPQNRSPPSDLADQPTTLFTNLRTSIPSSVIHSFSC